MSLITVWTREIRDHKWLAVRAIVVGWAALFGLWIFGIGLWTSQADMIKLPNLTMQ